MAKNERVHTRCEFDGLTLRLVQEIRLTDEEQNYMRLRNEARGGSVREDVERIADTYESVVEALAILMVFELPLQILMDAIDGSGVGYDYPSDVCDEWFGSEEDDTFPGETELMKLALERARNHDARGCREVMLQIKEKLPELPAKGESDGR